MTRIALFQSTTGIDPAANAERLVGAIAAWSVTAKAPATVRRRWISPMPLSGGVRRVRDRTIASLDSPSLRDRSRAMSADWLNPRCHSRVR